MIDFHCHIDLYPNPWEVAEHCRRVGLRVLSVTTTPSAFHGTALLGAGYDLIQTSLGLHPQLAHERKGELGLFYELLPSVQFVGEVGLDGAPEYKSHWRDQVMVFDRILTACRLAGGRILSVHSRRATSEVLDHLERTSGAGTPILHWFSGSLNELSRAIALDCWFSVGPAMLSSERGRTLVAEMPRDRLLTESDGPFAKVDGRAVLPWEVSLAEHQLSVMWHEPRQQIAERLNANLLRLMRQHRVLHV